jgi:hypothetical protein
VVQRTDPGSKVLGKRPDETVDFFEFLGGVNACLAFEEVLSEVERVFHEPRAGESWGGG